jgi:hypothetical protein
MVCNTCGLTLKTRYCSFSHCVAFPMCIAATCYLLCIVLLLVCASLFTHVYCFTICVLLQLPDAG